MLEINQIPARTLQRSYKAILNRVKNKKAAVVLTTNNKPQAAIVSLEDLDRIQQSKKGEFSMELLEHARKTSQEISGLLPADLRKRADEILYSKP